MVTLSSTIINELDKTSRWWSRTKKILSAKMKNYTLFPKDSIKDEIPFKNPDLKTVTK